MMKRVIAILAVSAIVTTAVYAQAAIAGTVQTRFNMFNGNLSDSNSDLTMGGVVNTAWFQLSGTNADGTLGGMWRLRNQDIVRDAPWFHRAFVWWRPIEQMRIWLGIDDDGMFDSDHFMGWGFHQGENGDMFNHHWDFWRRIFPSHFSTFGLALSFTDFGVDGLGIHFILPTGHQGWPGATADSISQAPSVQEMLAGFRFHMTYALPGLGLVQFQYNAPGGIRFFEWHQQINQYTTEWGDATNLGQIGLSFLLNGLQFGNLLIGGAFIIPDSDNDLDLHLGLGLELPNLADLMTLRFRVGAQVLTRFNANHNEYGDWWNDGDGVLTANIMPVIPLGPGSLMVDLGLTMALPDGDFEAERHLGWSVIPAYRLPLPSGSFQIGLQLWSGLRMGGNQAHLTGNNDVHMNIPMFLTFSF